MGGKSRLIIGPGAHSSINDLLPYDFKDYQVVWFDHYFRGIDKTALKRGQRADVCAGAKSVAV
ncbi:hypothetical protein [Ammoniphilus resinae]|uniref:Uncharacterized protein n=1 Tax=Ammoniphilus resinae TaxID=861532 RepID=A0ABS4GXU6_9BACL|nr:hypothetical protein [Ammoniphilus resinae]MBP1934690.1 hypothetical protein [Ammoniphilus resinae]